MLGVKVISEQSFISIHKPNVIFECHCHLCHHCHHCHLCHHCHHCHYCHYCHHCHHCHYCHYCHLVTTVVCVHVFLHMPYLQLNDTVQQMRMEREDLLKQISALKDQQNREKQDLEASVSGAMLYTWYQ